MTRKKVRVFLTRTLTEAKQKNTRVKDIISEFITYKETNNPGHYFGRDADFYKPQKAIEEELFHIHLLDVSMKGYKRKQMLDQYYRTSDSFLIYCHGIASPDHYLLIDILWADGHKKINDDDLMNNYAAFAESFRKGY